MPRMQLYCPEELYRWVEERRMRTSELLQGAVRAEVRRHDLLTQTERFLRRMVTVVGEPRAKDHARAREILGTPTRPGKRRKS